MLGKLKEHIARCLWGDRSYLFPGAVISLTVNKPKPLPLAWSKFLRWKVASGKAEMQSNTLVVREEAVGSEARSKIEAILPWGQVITSFDITTVPWPVGPYRVNMLEELGMHTIVGSFGNKVLFTDERSLFCTEDGFQTRKALGPLPSIQRYRSDRSPIVKTEAGYFFRTDTAVLRSHDLEKWSVEIEIPARAMFQHFDHWFDRDTGTTYVFAGEYSTESDRRHGIYRGRYTKDGGVEWERLFEFYSSREGQESPGLFPSVRHIHVVTVDQKTGWLWVATGDSDRESGLFVSKDRGKTFTPFALGSQNYRTLMVHFTDKYVYWNMDTHKKDQSVFRVAREHLDTPITPIVTGSQTEVGKTYMKLYSAKKDIIPVRPGQKYVETEPRRVSQKSAAVIMDGDSMQHCETVATLPYGTQWYGIEVKDDTGKPMLLMSASPESQVPDTKEVPHRDWNSRLFALYDLESDAPKVMEVYVAKPKDGLNKKQSRYNRIDPRCQDQDGNIYFMAHNSIHTGALKGRLRKV